MDSTVEQTLVEKIQQQDRLIAELQAELQEARQASVSHMLGQLRLREAVLLYVGRDDQRFSAQIAADFGSEIGRAVSTRLFVLDNAPLASETREAMRTALNHGMNRW